MLSKVAPTGRTGCRGRAAGCRPGCSSGREFERNRASALQTKWLVILCSLQCLLCGAQRCRLWPERNKPLPSTGARPRFTPSGLRPMSAWIRPMPLHAAGYSASHASCPGTNCQAPRCRYFTACRAGQPIRQDQPRRSQAMPCSGASLCRVTVRTKFPGTAGADAGNERAPLRRWRHGVDHGSQIDGAELGRHAPRPSSAEFDADQVPATTQDGGTVLNAHQLEAPLHR